MPILTYDTKSTTSLSKDNRSNAGSFTNDSKSSNSLSGDSRSSAGTLSTDSKSFQGITWGDDFNTWVNELRTWAEVTSLLTLDTRN